MREVGVRELRANLKAVLDEVEAGETVVVTRDGRPIVKIEPVKQELPPEVKRLLEAGKVHWGGQPMTELPELIELTGAGPTVSDLIVQERDHAAARHVAKSAADEPDALPR